MLTNQYKTIQTKQQGFTLVEFMISMALSLAAILVVTSIYVTSFQIDSKTIKYSRLNDEVTSIIALLSEDIKRAGYVANAGLGVPRPVEFRTLLVSEFAGESNNSCILFSYDFNDNNGYDGNDEAFGYRLNDGELETRQGGRSCTQTLWQSLTDPNFVTISNLVFKCKVSDDNDTDDYETDSVSGVATHIELTCAAGNLPSDGDGDGDGIKDGNGIITVEISFTATLVDDADISLTASEKVLVRNKNYD